MSIHRQNIENQNSGICIFLRDLNHILNSQTQPFNIVRNLIKIKLFILKQSLR